MANNAITEKDVLEFVHRFAQDYESGSSAFFDDFSPDASFFALSVPTRIDSTEEYRRGFQHRFEAGQARHSQVLSPEVRLLGDTAALVTFHNRIQVENSSANSRITLVVEKQGDKLLASHLHASPLGAPAVPSEAPDLRSVSVLEERVATAIGAVGTPK